MTEKSDIEDIVFIELDIRHRGYRFIEFDIRHRGYRITELEIRHRGYRITELPSIHLIVAMILQRSN